MSSVDVAVLNGDGRVGYSNATWATVHDAVNGDAPNTVLNYVVMQGNRLNAGTYYIYRGFFPALSDLPAGAVITDVKLHLFLFSGGTSPSSGTTNLSLVRTSQASPNALQNSDFSELIFQSIGDVAVDQSDADGTEYIITISDPAENVPTNDYILIGLIEKDHDLADVAATADRYTSFYSSNESTEALRPFYRITYSAPEFYISGVVTLNQAPVEGAVVRCIRQSDNVAIAQQTTDVSGEYEFTELEELELYHLAVEYEAVDLKYNALSLWDVAPVEVV